MPTYEQLEKAYQKGQASLEVDHINHREFIKGKFRYFCGWSSRIQDGGIGWYVYKKQKA